METISDALTRDHQHCDDLYADFENAIAEDSWGHAPQTFEAFRKATLLHFERDQMRTGLAALAQVIERRDAQACLGYADSLLMLMRQHNMKEEQILYPMADQVLADSADTLVEAMLAVEASAAGTP